MGHRRGQTGRGKEGRDPATYYAATDSDRRYAQRTRQRVAQQARRRWVIRLAILAALAFVIWLWGDDALRALRVQAHITGQEVRQAGEHIKDGTDRRSGADLLEEESQR